MCRGNIDSSQDFYDDLNKEYVSDSFIKKGSTSQTCCKITGMCTNNTNSNENVECPENTSIIDDKEGSTIEECCEAGAQNVRVMKILILIIVVPIQ